MAISDYSATASENGTVLGVNLAENCPAANVNNGIRQLCADIAAGFNFSVLASFFSANSLSAARSALGVSGGSTSANNFFNLTNTANKIPYMTGSDGWSLTDMFPVGGIIPVASASAPAGFLECDGSAVSRTTYASLFAVVGTTYGAGDGSTTFNVPDLRGEFIRGWDHGRGVDSGRALGSSQADELEAHTHTFSVSNNDTNNGSYADGTTESSPSGTVTTSSTGGTETRPRNVALLYAVKY